MDLLELEERRPAIPLLFATPPASGPISEDGKIVSEKSYWEKYYEHPDFNYEWVNGRLEEKPMSNLATFSVYLWLLKLLQMYLDANEYATLTGLEMGFTVPLPPEKQSIRDRGKKKRKNVRKPDLGIVLKNNPIPLYPDDNSYDGILDLCIEAISYTTKKAEERDTIEKREEYEYARVKEYYILDDRKKETTFLRLNRWGIYQEIKRIDGDIIRSQVLPGFQFRVSDLYRQPSLDELVKDEVYQGFVMVRYQEEKKRAEKAERQLAYEQQQKQEAFRRAQEERKEKEQALRQAQEERKEKEQALRRASEEKEEALRRASEEKEEALRRASEEKEEALKRASEEKKEALRRAEEQRKEKEEALKQASEEREKNQRLLALLAQNGLSLD